MEQSQSHGTNSAELVELLENIISHLKRLSSEDTLDYVDQKAFEKIGILLGLTVALLNKMAPKARTKLSLSSTVPYLNKEVRNGLEKQLFRLLDLVRAEQWDEVYYLILREHAVQGVSLSRQLADLLLAAPFDPTKKIELFAVLNQIILGDVS
ncbi:MAG: hypothetical protein NZT61_06645 [Deltaproteobacteria bacterium]|nr:hypothetical protein [Deltaproteobacteria bacterium]